MKGKMTRGFNTQVQFYNNGPNNFGFLYISGRIVKKVVINRDIEDF